MPRADLIPDWVPSVCFTTFLVDLNTDQDHILSGYKAQFRAALNARLPAVAPYSRCAHGTYHGAKVRGSGGGHCVLRGNTVPTPATPKEATTRTIHPTAPASNLGAPCSAVGHLGTPLRRCTRYWQHCCRILLLGKRMLGGSLALRAHILPCPASPSSAGLTQSQPVDPGVGSATGRPAPASRRSSGWCSWDAPSWCCHTCCTCHTRLHGHGPGVMIHQVCFSSPCSCGRLTLQRTAAAS